MSLQDTLDKGSIDPSTVPQHFQNSVPVMPDIDIFLHGILKLLLNLKPGKAAGPDNLRLALLKELREEIAPILQVIFTRSFETGKLPADWCRVNVTPLFKKGEKSLAASYYTVRSPLLAFSARSLSTSLLQT